jgi:hypothetical protein
VVLVCLLVMPAMAGLPASPALSADHLRISGTVTADDDPRRDEISPDVGVIEIVDLQNDGSIEVAAAADARADLQLRLSNVKGRGTIYIVIDRAASITLADVSSDGIRIEAQSVGHLVHEGGALNVANFQIIVGECESIWLGPNLASDELQFDISASVGRLTCSGITANRLTLRGKGPEHPTVNDCRLILDGPQSSAPSKSPDYQLENLSFGRLHLAGSPDSEAWGTAKPTFRLGNLNVQGLGIVADFAGIPLHGLEIRDLCFSRPTAVMKVLTPPNNLKYGGCDFLSIVGVAEVPSVSVHIGGPLSKLFLRDIDCGSILFALDEGLARKIGNVEIGGLSVAHGIEAEPEPILHLAEVNSPMRSFDRAQLFHLLAEQAFYRTPDGKIRNMRVEAALGLRKAEMSQRKFWSWLAGRLVYLLTGLGYAICPPVLAAVALVTLFAGVYWLVLYFRKAQTEVVTLRHLGAALLFSIVATFSLGSGLETWLIRYWRRQGLPRTARRSRLLVSAVVRLQGFVFFIQVTLLGLFFGETSFFRW